MLKEKKRRENIGKHIEAGTMQLVFREVIKICGCFFFSFLFKKTKKILLFFGEISKQNL